MTKALPGERGLWGKIVQGFNYVFRPNITASQIIADTQRVNTERGIEANAERDRKHQELEQVKMKLQVLQHQDTLAFQSDKADLNREFQGE